jgi:hypothetical protein
MRISRADHSPIEHPGQSRSAGTRTATALPRLWPQLPAQTQRQLAQQIGRLLQRRQQLLSELQETEEDRADDIAL